MQDISQKENNEDYEENGRTDQDGHREVHP